MAGLKNHIKILKRAGNEMSSLGVDNWCPNLGDPFRQKLKESSIKLIFVPGGTAELTAPIDVEAGQFVKLFITLFEEWLATNIDKMESRR